MCVDLANAKDASRAGARGLNDPRLNLLGRTNPTSSHASLRCAPNLPVDCLNGAHDAEDVEGSLYDNLHELSVHYVNPGLWLLPDDDGSGSIARVLLDQNTQPQALNHVRTLGQGLASYIRDLDRRLSSAGNEREENE